MKKSNIWAACDAGSRGAWRRCSFGRNHTGFGPARGESDVPIAEVALIDISSSCSFSKDKHRHLLC